MYKAIKAVMMLAVVVVATACEGTIELGDDLTLVPKSSAASSGSGKADSLAGPTQMDPTQLGGGGAGEQLYVTHCSACHGADATGAASWPGSIQGYAPIAPIVKSGRDSMPPIAIDDASIAAIQEYLTSLVPAVEGPKTGLDVYAQTCAGCHGAEGEGTAQGPQLRFRDPALFEVSVRQGRNGMGNPSTMPAYDTDAVSPEQLTEMVEWMDSFPNETDGDGLYGQFCANCHGADGLGGPSRRPLAGRSRAGEIVRDGHALGQYSNRTEYMSRWSTVELSDYEIGLIEAYMTDM